MGNTSTTKAPSKAKANKLALDYLEALIEEKAAKTRKNEIATELSAYCKKNGLGVINEVLLPYEKQGAPVITGATGKKLTAVKKGLVESLPVFYLNKSLNMPKLLEAAQTDKSFQRTLKKAKINIEPGATKILFKHV